MEKLSLWFPFTIKPNKVTKENIFYTQEAYNSILEQMRTGLDVFPELYGEYKAIGRILTTTDDGKISIDIYDPLYIKILNDLGDSTFYVGTFLDGEADTNSEGVLIVSSATVLKVAILSTLNSCSLFDIAQGLYTIVKEPTFDLDKLATRIIEKIEGDKNET